MKKHVLICALICLSLNSCYKTIGYTIDLDADYYATFLENGSYAILYPDVPTGSALDVTKEADKKFKEELGSCYENISLVYSSYVNGNSRPDSPSNLDRVKSIAPHIDFIIYISARFDKNNDSQFSSRYTTTDKERVNATLEIIEVSTGKIVFTKELTASTEDSSLDDPNDSQHFARATDNELIKRACAKLIKRTAKAFKEKEIGCN
jgi:hypothetical protein